MREAKAKKNDLALPLTKEKLRKEKIKTKRLVGEFVYLESKYNRLPEEKKAKYKAYRNKIKDSPYILRSRRLEMILEETEQETEQDIFVEMKGDEENKGKLGLRFIEIGHI